LVDAVSALETAFLASSTAVDTLTFIASIWSASLATLSEPELVAKNFTYSVEMAGWSSKVVKHIR
jgi:hypothetical protein